MAYQSPQKPIPILNVKIWCQCTQSSDIIWGVDCHHCSCFRIFCHFLFLQFYCHHQLFLFMTKNAEKMKCGKQAAQELRNLHNSSTLWLVSQWLPHIISLNLLAWYFSTENGVGFSATVKLIVSVKWLNKYWETYFLNPLDVFMLKNTAHVKMNKIQSDFDRHTFFTGSSLWFNSISHSSF